MPAGLRRTLLAVIALLTAALATYAGTTPNPGQVPPVLTPVPSASAAPVPDDPSAPPPDAGCVPPAGQTKLLDQDPSDSQLPWKRNGNPKVTIFFATKGVPADWRPNLLYAQAAWNKSPCLDVRVVDACSSGQNCVSVAVLAKMPDGDDGNFDAVERGGYTTGGKITLLAGLSPDERKNVTVHEAGHAVGLVHRKTKHVLMNGDTYDDVFDPDAVDYANLLFSYGRQK